jgi:hypothetical protein
MQRWEYCVVTSVRVRAGSLNPGRPKLELLTPEGLREMPLTAGPTSSNDVAQAIAELGDHGWELVGAVNTSPRVHCLYFKRPKP